MSGKTFLVVDLWNLLARARFATRGDPYEVLGMTLHITLSAIKFSAKKHKADHLVIAMEGHSWRKDYDERYKKNRLVKLQQMTPKDREIDEVFTLAFKDFQSFLKDKTNVTVLQNPICEADDMIAEWVQFHPDDNHVIISSDSDFQQLVKENVILVDGVNRKTYKITGVYDEKDKPVINKKTKKPELVDPEYLLFEKIIRGDSSDNVFAAFPGVREPKIIAAFNDRQNKGYDFNNFMMSRWTDKDGKEHMVRDRFAHNKVLIDLTAQPDIVKNSMRETVLDVYKENKNVSNIGFSLLKLLGKYDLPKLAESSTELVDILKKRLTNDQ